MMRRLGISSIALALVVLPATARAQIGGSGSIQGSILDASGAALPGATVTATHLSTGVETVRQATGAGVYTVSPLAPGDYRVTVVLQGFQTFVQESVTVDALGVVGLNVTLKVGGITQEVTVSASPPMLRTADGRLGQTIRNDVYTALPLVMNTGGPRDPTAFMFLMPGVQSVGRWGNVMGGQDFTNDTYVEGVPITNAVVQGEGRNLSMGISVEAIDQFQVETSGTAVMYNGQGASNYVVKSGTNLFRGSAFEFFRNKGLDSKAFFAATKPDDNQHEFGFTLGGPLRRNQAFFFVAYDGYRDRRQTESRLISIPTAAQRNGDFSALPVVIYDPATTRPNPNGTGFVRDPFPGNIIPPAASRRSRATCSPTCPIPPTATCRTTISAASCRSGSTTTTSRPRSTCGCRRGTRSRCCSRTASAARRRRIAAAATRRRSCRSPTPRPAWSKRFRPPRR